MLDKSACRPPAEKTGRGKLRNHPSYLPPPPKWPNQSRDWNVYAWCWCKFLLCSFWLTLACLVFFCVRVSTYGELWVYMYFTFVCLFFFFLNTFPLCCFFSCQSQLKRNCVNLKTTCWHFSQPAALPPAADKLYFTMQFWQVVFVLVHKTARFIWHIIDSWE